MVLKQFYCKFPLLTQNSKTQDSFGLMPAMPIWPKSDIFVAKMENLKSAYSSDTTCSTLTPGDFKDW